MELKHRDRRLPWMGGLIVVMLLVGALPSLASHGPAAHPEMLSRASFTDDVSAQFRVKLDDRATEVINVDDPSDVVTARIAVDPNGPMGWHTHSGPVIVTVADGQLTYVGEDCVERVYPAGTAFIDPGHGNIHRAYAGPDGAVLVATFLGVDGPLSPAHDGEPPCNS